MNIKNNPIKFAQGIAGVAGSLISGSRSSQSSSNLPVDNTHSHSKRGSAGNSQGTNIQTALGKINSQIKSNSISVPGELLSQAPGQVGGIGASSKPSIQSLFGGMGGSTMSRIASMFGRR